MLGGGAEHLGSLLAKSISEVSVVKMNGALEDVRCWRLWDRLRVASKGGFGVPPTLCTESSK